jgi:PAS domain S-box-containing protein
MADFPAPLLPPDAVGSEEFLHTLLEVALTGFILFRPVYDAAKAAIVDLTYEYLNPAAQRMLQLPPRPADSFLTRYPGAEPTGIFAFYRDAFLSGQTERHNVYFRHDGLDGYFHLAARRQGTLLVVSFTDTNDQPRTAVEEELRRSQAREHAARAEAEAERNLLQALLKQAPVAIGLFQGDDCVVRAANDLLCAMWGSSPAQVLGRPLLEGVPELRDQGFAALIQQVARTQVPLVGAEAPAQLRQPAGELATRYFNFIYQPLYDPSGAVLGVVDIATDVTEQVRARQQVQVLNQELAATNASLQAANAEHLALNETLASAQQRLQRLNEELEARVGARTQALQQSLQEAEHQREQARQQQRLLGQILGQMPAAIATLTGPEHRYSFANEHYQTLVGGRAVVGRPVAEALPEVQEQGFVALLDQVYATGEPALGTDTPIMLHGPADSPAELRYVDFIYQPLFDGQQRPQGILAFILDVTDRVRARKQADTLQAAMLAVVQRQAQQRQDLYQVFEQAPTAILLLRGPEHRIEYFNPAYGYFFPGQSLLGRPMAEAHPGTTADGLIALLDHVYATGEMYVGTELPLVLPGDEPRRTRYFNFTYRAYLEHNQTVGVSVFATEATEQVLARRAMDAQRDAQQAELQRIFEQAPVAICVFEGPAYILRIVNPPMAAMLGHAASELVGQPFFEMLPELVAQGLPALLDGVRQTGTPFLAQEQGLHLSRHAADEIGYFNYVYQPLHDATGAIVGVICVATEVTDQVLARQRVQALNAELLRTNERLTRTNTDLDTFVYTASHDLKSPITNVEGLLLALREHLPAAAFAEALVPRLLDMIGDAVTRFQQTLAHLTDISRLQQEQYQATETVDVAALIEAVRLDMLPELAAAGATLTIALAPCPPLQFSAKNLRSVVYNLLSNAVKYRDPSRAAFVQLRCYPAPGHVVLEVQDNGLGLSESQQGELFRLFRRLHNHVAGSGVGLYMVKRIVENAHGTITVHSQLDVGSTFRVVLPA